MIVVITSWAPTAAFRKPAIAAQAAPASAAAAIARKMCVGLARSTHTEPTHVAMSAPTMYWPWPPMLKSPHRNANATASPVRMSVDVVINVCWRFAAAVADARGSPDTGSNAESLVFHGNQTRASENGTPMS